MNVTVVASHVTPTYGLERCVLRLASELRVPVVCIGEPSGAPGRQGVEISTLGEGVRGWRRLASLHRLRRWTRSQSGVVVAAGLWAAVPLLACRRSLPFRVIVWEHSLSAENVRAAPALRILRGLASFLYARADLVVCVSDDLADQVRTIARDVPVVTVPNYLPDGRSTPVPAQTPAEPRRGTRLLSVGALSAVKNHELAIRAMSYLPPDVTLDILGQGGLRTELEELAHDLDLDGRVTFHGFVDPGAFYDAADLVVLPSLGETFGLAMFEAASHHVPLVAVDFPLARRLVGDYLPGRLTRPEARRLAETVLTVLADPPDHAEFQVADQRRLTDFATHRITSAWRAALTGDVDRCVELLALR